jgi:hypothetical protein
MAVARFLLVRQVNRFNVNRGPALRDMAAIEYILLPV